MVQGLQLVLFLLIFVAPRPSFAGESLTVTTLDARLYPYQDNESKFIATLEKGEKLQPLAQVVGNQAWYMVKTSKGIIGWVQATDVSGSAPQEIPTKEELLSQCLKRADTEFEDAWAEHCKLHGFKGGCTVLPVAVAYSLKQDRRSARDECIKLHTTKSITGK
jgi:hypothetical protein